MTGLLEGKTSIVTGAASGIGEASAKLFAAEGANVLVVDLPDRALADVHKHTPNVALHEQDVTDTDAPRNITQAAVNAFGGVDILFNNAGMVGGDIIDSQKEDDWRRVLEVNLHSVYRISQAAVQEMKKRGGGRIINIGSVRSQYADVGASAYTTSKHAIAGLTKSIAVEYGKDGITCNYILPGAIITGITRAVKQNMPEFDQYWTQRSPIGRWGEASDIANAVLFLASDEASFVSGMGLPVDGGVMCHN